MLSISAATSDASDARHDDDDEDAADERDDADELEPTPSGRDDLKSRTVPELKALLKLRSLKVGGPKPDLIQRLIDFDALGPAEYAAAALEAKLSKKTVRQIQNQEGFVNVLRGAIAEVDAKALRDDAAVDPPEVDTAVSAPSDVKELYRKVLPFVQHVNSNFAKPSRERTGGRLRVDDFHLSSLLEAACCACQLPRGHNPGC